MRDLLLLILLSTALGVNAQWWEHAYQPSEEVRMDQVLPLTEGRWAVFCKPTFAGTHRVRVYNADGSVAWEQSGPYGNGQGLGDVVLLPDSSVLQVGAFDQCDYIGPDSRVSRIAADGTLVTVYHAVHGLFPDHGGQRHGGPDRHRFAGFGVDNGSGRQRGGRVPSACHGFEEDPLGQ